MANIFFSFVMPAYKQEYIKKAIDSILAQTYQNFELIIVNDASPEDIGSVVSQYKDERIRYEINEKNIGGTDLVRNWNHCVSFSQYDYVVLAADDDMFAPNFLKHAVPLIEKYPSVDLIRSGVKKIGTSEEVLEYEFPLPEYLSGAEFTYYWSKGFISCISNYIFRKTALEAMGGFVNFPPAHFSDDATALAMSKHGVACMATPDFCFRVSTLNLSNQNSVDLTLDQIEATNMFADWLQNVHLKCIDDFSDSKLFERASYFYFKRKYVYLMDIFISKLPMSKLWSVIGIVRRSKHLFGKEKMITVMKYLISKF